MPEYTNNAIQTVAAGANVLFTDTPVRCCKGLVVHRDGAGIITLRGIPDCNNRCYRRYRVSFGGNIAVPTGGTVEAITIALAVNGEGLASTTAIYVPAAVDTYGNVYISAYISVPRGCCYTISAKNTSTQPINVQNANLIVES